MFLTKLEIQGFKTFAQKTTLSFLPPKGGISPLTAVVGPNGSGKSNLSDAIRWALGEQSLKLLRGKESQDVIFSGSAGRGRSGFAEVSMTFNNEDRAMPVEFAEVTVTRRLYRDGNSEYLLNGQAARLSDIQLLLAQANVGQRSYSVIGQGMVDHILVSTPEERKAFFDDATGVKQFQIKRHEAMLKLKRTYENLSEVEMLLQEIEPRLRSLKRQVSRLEQREEVEKELRAIERRYYGGQWWQLVDELGGVRERFAKLDEQAKREAGSLSGLEERVAVLEREDKAQDAPDQGLVALQKSYHDLQRRRSALRDEQFKIQKEMELAKVRAQSNWAPLPLGKIIEEVEGVNAGLKGLRGLAGLEEIYAAIDGLLDRSSKLVGRLQRPSPEDVKPDPKLVARLEELAAEMTAAEASLKSLEAEMQAHAVTEKKVRSELFDLQRELRQKQQAIHLAENQRNAVSIELARLEERQANLGREMDEQLKDLAGAIRATRDLPPSEGGIKGGSTPEQLHSDIQRLRYKLELIGGIDPEIVKEYEETNARFTFLDGQVTDLREAIDDTEKIIDELDEEIHKQSEKAFKKINDEFQRFFQMLFGGGSCSLVKMTRDEIAEIPTTVQEEEAHHEADTTLEAIKSRIKEREDRVVGIDIQATPPGKKLKGLNLLSGGERALTSIALVSAIMAVNPGPFVVLDEVDAALDEANTFRFAGILEELAKLTQFIVITHNRATMEKADVLYGVTMGDDGVSNLLSVDLTDVTAGATARR